MNNKRMYLALFLAVTMGLSMFFLPMAPVTRTEVSTPSTFTPEQERQIEDFYEQVAQPGFTPEVDSLLAAWQSGEVLDSSVVNVGGKPSVLIFGAPWVDIDRIRQAVDLNWWVDLKLFKTMKAVLPNAAALDLLLEIDGVSAISADKNAPSVNEGIVTPAPPTEEIGLDMTELRDVVGASGTTASGYTGAGVLVGHVDTGGDFGQPDLQDAYSADSYDPTGQGLVYTMMHGNSTAVVNATKWLEDGNVLTFTNATGTYLNITLDIDPLCNYMAGNILSPQYYVYGTSGLNTTYARAFFEQYIWKPVKVPDPSAIVGDYHWGFCLQSRPTTSGGGPRIFTPVLVYNDTATYDWTLAVDWDGAWVWGNFFNGGWRYRTWNFGYQSYRDAILAVLDNDFTDDILDEVYTLDNPNVAHDYTGDGVDDSMIGSLCWVYDTMTNVFPGTMGTVVLPAQTVFHGFRDDGDAFAVYFDAGTHGTATAAHVAASGDYTYVDANTGSTFYMEGIAPDADIMSVKAITSGSDYGAYLWVCGFDYNETTDGFYYSGNHRADLVTNSWGWVTEPSSQFNYLSFTWEILSTPMFLGPTYPGVLHVFSAGNEGEGFMTIGPPGAATAVLSVAASTSSKWLEYLYGPDQDIEGIASFTSKGPDFNGYPKPDVLAPGLAAYSVATFWGHYWIPQWAPGATFANYTLFSGTSQSAPVAAGCAALLIEALEARAFEWDPMDVKTIIQSTAQDMGYDPATQGFGRINIDAACNFAQTDTGLWSWNFDSYYLNALLLDNAYASWGIIPGSYLGAGVTNTTWKLSDIIVADGSVFFGAVLPDDVVTVHQTIYDNLAGPAVTSPGWTTDAYYMVEAERLTFTDVTFSYNDTVMKDNQMYGFYNLRDELTPALYDSAVTDYTYVTVGVSFREEDVSGMEPWMFLYDWTDNDPNDGKPNLWNATAAQGNELTRLTSAQNPSNTNMMPFATYAASIDAALDGNMTLVIHDPIHDEDMTATGNEFVCTVIFWEEVVAPEIAIVEDDVYTYNFTLTVPTNAEAGIHQGFIDIDGGLMRIPYSYNVVADLVAAEGVVNTVADGYGAELSPYDSAMYGCMGFDTGTWDYRSYIIQNTHATAGYITIRVIWADEGNDMYVALYSDDNTLLVDGSGSTSTTTALVATLPTANTGYFYLLVNPVALNGTEGLPVEYTIEVMWIVSIPELQFSFTANDVTTPVAINPDDTLVGDHVVVNATYPIFGWSSLPEFEVESITISFLSGLYVVRTGDVALDPGDNWPVNPELTGTYALEIVDGIKAGDTVKLRLEMFDSAADPALIVYKYNGVPLTAADAPIITIDAGTTGDTVESGSFVASEDMSIACVIYSFPYTGAYPDTYELIVDSMIGIDATEGGRIVTYDTYQFQKNGSFVVRVSATTGTNVAFLVDFGELRFENLFSPQLSAISVTGAGAQKTISWSVTDKNAGDDHYYELYLSSDGGDTYQLYRMNWSSTTYVWDSTGFQQKDNYRMRVVVFDNDPNYGTAAPGYYWPGLTDTSDSASFSAGTVTTTTTITTTTSTTTTTTTVPVTIDPLLIGLFGGIGIGVVIILILFLVRKK